MFYIRIYSFFLHQTSYKLINATYVNIDVMNREHDDDALGGYRVAL